MLGSLSRYKEIIVIEDYTFAGGSARPIYTYYRHKINRGENDILFLRLTLRRSLLKLLLLLLFKNRIIINGISAFHYWTVFLVCFLKKDVIVYLHEAAPHVEPFIKQNPWKFRLFRRVLQKKKIAFVSEWQRKYFEQLAPVKRSKLVYNAIGFPNLEGFSKNEINIVMIAFQSRYKNVPFFSKVADLAKEKNLPYKFHWIGGEGGDMNQMYHSPHVNWMGDQEQIMDLLNHFDVFFFPSYGDTFGLVLIEALYKGKRIVSYRENGLAPHLEVLDGCKVFDRLNEDEALNDIAAVLKDEVDINQHRALAYELCDVRKLEERLNDLFTM
jgi:glycosyltransferase involved in cell wall biosynthesis